MSVTSSATASRDREVPSPESFCDRLCLLSITRGDGTPMDASSILEEDIVGICVQKSHTHPLGVLQYLVAKSVILFSTTEDLHQASHDLMNMTVLCDEAIRVQTLAFEASHTLLPNKLLRVREHCIVSMPSLKTSMIMSSNSSSKISHRRLHNMN